MKLESKIIKQIQYLAQIDLRGYLREQAFLEFLYNELNSNNIPYRVESFFNFYPYQKETILLADRRQINCLGTSFVSGSFKEGDFDLIDSTSGLTDLNYESPRPNINYNPLCVSSISRPTFYNLPSLAINQKDKVLIQTAKKVEASVEVEKIKYAAANVLVGNYSNPSAIIFCHLDTIGMGAVDNISGFSFCLEYCKQNLDELDNLLFVFSSNEELSYDGEIYWGFGYRRFEKSHEDILNRAKSVVVVDCIGYGTPIIHADQDIIELGFPIKSLKIKRGTRMISGSIEKLMEFYHSDSDNPELIRPNFVKETIAAFKKMISSS